MMGNDSPFNIKGIQNVFIHRFDKNIHIPSMPKNYRKISTLDVVEHRFVDNGGLFKVNKGVHVELKGYHKYINLYVLNGAGP